MNPFSLPATAAFGSVLYLTIFKHIYFRFIVCIIKILRAHSYFIRIVDKIILARVAVSQIIHRRPYSYVILLDPPPNQK